MQEFPPLKNNNRYTHQQHIPMLKILKGITILLTMSKKENNLQMKIIADMKYIIVAFKPDFGPLFIAKYSY